MLKSALALTLLSIGPMMLMAGEVRSEIASKQHSSKKAKTEQCPAGPHHMRVDVRHIEGGGIGYSKGYTTLEAFFASDPSRWAVMPFLDIRGHVFNDGRYAANAGIGARWNWECGAYGINGYYDYRQTHRRIYNQVGAGLERLGKLVDVRINGYLPVGKKITHPYDPEFGGFRGNSVLVKRKYQYAMKGIDGEVGFHFGKTSDFDFYGAIGPYYFIGEIGRQAWGGKGRLAGYYKEYVTLELSDSWDNVFKNNVQGQLTLTYPFGHRSKAKRSKSCSDHSCDFAEILAARMVQPVAREEIVVVNSHHKKKAADNFFIFVNNLSHSAGTFESPYATLAAAETNSKPGDYIYVFAGDGTPTGMNNGITLQDNQQLLSSSSPQVIATNLGTITIPPQTTIIPTIGNAGTQVITIANNNVVSGFNINLNPLSVGDGIVNKTPITNATIINNNLIIFSGDGGIVLTNVSGNLTIANNSFSCGDFNNPAIGITNTNIHNANYLIDNNYISISQESISLIYTNCSAITTNITNNLIHNDDTALVLTIDNTSLQTEHIFNISSNNMTTQDLPSFDVTLTDFARASIIFSDNTLISNDFAPAFQLTTSNDSFCYLNCKNNNIQSVDSIFVVTTGDNSGVSMDLSNNYLVGQGQEDTNNPCILIAANNNSIVGMIASENFIFGGDFEAVQVTTQNNAIVDVSLFRNTLQSIDGDVVDFTSNSTAANGLTLIGNTILASKEVPPNLLAINCVAAGTGSLTATVIRNDISFADAAISNFGTGNLRAIVDRNRLLGALVFITNGSTGTLCQRFNNNFSDVVQYSDGTKPYTISNTSTGKLFLEPPVGNVGLFTLVDVSPVTPGTCID